MSRSAAIILFDPPGLLCTTGELTTQLIPLVGAIEIEIGIAIGSDA